MLILSYSDNFVWFFSISISFLVVKCHSMFFLLSMKLLLIFFLEILKKTYQYFWERQFSFNPFKASIFFPKPSLKFYSPDPFLDRIWWCTKTSKNFCRNPIELIWAQIKTSQTLTSETNLLKIWGNFMAQPTGILSGMLLNL